MLLAALLMAIAFAVSFITTFALGVRGAILAFFSGPLMLMAMRGDTLLTGRFFDTLIDMLATGALYWFLGSYPGSAVALFLRPETPD